MNGKLAYMLREIGVPPHLLGYDYLIDAVNICLENRTALHHPATLLYVAISNKRSVTKSSVERDIRHAITWAFDNGDIDILRSVFGNTINLATGKVTNGHFIAAIIAILENEPNHQIFKGSSYEIQST